MYEPFFGMQRRPFSTTPDPSCFFTCDAIQTTLDELVVCVERGQGIGILVAPAGMGKTLLCQRLVRECGESFQPICLGSAGFTSRRALLQAILFEMGDDYSRKDASELRLDLRSRLKSLRPRRQALALIIDEAHLFEDELLEEVRVLSDLAHDGSPLVRVILSGQPDLEERLTQRCFDALNQRISNHVYLQTLTRNESTDYIAARLRWAGTTLDRIFTPDAVRVMVRASGGIPRCLNQLADHALLLAFASDEKPVGEATIREALNDLRQLPLQWSDVTEVSDIAGCDDSQTADEESADNVEVWAEASSALDLVAAEAEPDSIAANYEQAAGESHAVPDELDDPRVQPAEVPASAELWFDFSTAASGNADVEADSVAEGLTLQPAAASEPSPYHELPGIPDTSDSCCESGTSPIAGPAQTTVLEFGVTEEPVGTSHEAASKKDFPSDVAAPIPEVPVPTEFAATTESPATEADLSGSQQPKLDKKFVIANLAQAFGLSAPETKAAAEPGNKPVETDLSDRSRTVRTVAGIKFNLRHPAASPEQPGNEQPAEEVSTFNKHAAQRVEIGPRLQKLRVRPSDRQARPVSIPSQPSARHHAASSHRNPPAMSTTTTSHRQDSDFEVEEVHDHYSLLQEPGQHGIVWNVPRQSRAVTPPRQEPVATVSPVEDRQPVANAEPDRIEDSFCASVVDGDGFEAVPQDSAVSVDDVPDILAADEEDEVDVLEFPAPSSSVGPCSIAASDELQVDGGEDTAENDVIDDDVVEPVEVQAEPTVSEHQTQQFMASCESGPKDDQDDDATLRLPDAHEAVIESGASTDEVDFDAVEPIDEDVVRIRVAPDQMIDAIVPLLSELDECDVQPRKSGKRTAAELHSELIDLLAEDSADLEDEVGADVLDLCLDTQSTLQSLEPASFSLPDFEALDSALFDTDSEESVSYDIVMPELDACRPRIPGIPDPDFRGTGRTGGQLPESHAGAASEARPFARLFTELRRRRKAG